MRLASSLRLLPAVAATTCLSALAAVWYWPVIGPGARYTLGGDFAAQSYPWRRYATEELFRGRLPHWSPYQGFGFPFLADIETNVLYPVALLVSLLAGPDLSYRAVELQLALHHVIAGLGMFLVLGRAGAGRLAALVGAATFAFSGVLWAHDAHLTIMESVSWAPWVLLGGSYLAERPTGRRVAGTALALALSILGGHPQYPYYVGLALLMVVGVVGGERPRTPGGRARLLRLAIATGGASALALGLTAIQLLPTATLWRQSIRWQASAAYLGVGVLPLDRLLTLLIPLAYEGTARWRDLDELHGYMGILPLVLAAWAVTVRRDRWTRAFAVLGALALLAALGFQPFARLGGAGLFRIPARALVLFDLAVAGLAGLGAQALWDAAGTRPVRERWFRRGLLGASLAAVAGALWLAAWGLPPSLVSPLSPGFSTHYRGFAALVLASSLVVETTCRCPRPSWLGRGLVAAVVLFELFSFPRHLGWVARSLDAHWPPISELVALGERLGPHRAAGPILLRTEEADANGGLVYRVPLTSVYSSLALRRYGEFLSAIGPRLPGDSRAYDLMGATLVFGRGGDAGLVGGRPGHGPLGPGESTVDPRLEPAGRHRWAIRDPLPRAYLPVEVQRMPSRAALREALAVVDPRQAVLVEPGAAGVACPDRASAGAPAGHVEFLDDEPDRIRLRVRAGAPGPLVLSDTHYPGWRATVDGARVPIHRANGLFRMVCVPAGEHVVEFAFEPPGFLAGAALTGASGLLALLLLAGVLRRPAWMPPAALPALAARVPWWAWVIGVDVALLAVIALDAHWPRDPASSAILSWFALTHEMNLAVWWSGALLLLGALLMYERASTGRPDERWPWSVLAVISAGLSLDEVGSLHERLGSVSWRLLLALAVPLMAAAGWALVRLARSRDRRGAAGLVVVAYGLFVAVAGLEYLESIVGWDAPLDLGQEFEEGAELAGFLLLLLAASGHRRPAEGVVPDPARLVGCRRVLTLTLLPHALMALVVVPHLTDLHGRGNPVAWYPFAVYALLACRCLAAWEAAPRAARRAWGQLGGLLLLLSAGAVFSLVGLAPHIDRVLPRWAFEGIYATFLWLVPPVLLLALRVLGWRHRPLRRALAVMAALLLLALVWPTWWSNALTPALVAYLWALVLLAPAEPRRASAGG